jgi:hypothetical protein
MMPRRRRLGDCLAGAAGELLAHVLDHLPLARDELQRLGHVLAELVQNAAAARARRRGRMNDAFTRQVLRQRPTRRLAPLECLNRDLLARRSLGGDPRRRFGLRGIFFHVGQLQLELLEHRAAFRRLAELLVLELGDRELHLLDHELAYAHLSLGVARVRLRGGEGLALRQDDCMRAGEIGWKRISGAHQR